MLSLSKHWLLNVLPLLMNENVEVQRKADSFVGFMLPTIVDEYEKIDHCISEYMDKQSPKLIFELTNLSAQNEIFALQVWSKMVVILGRHLHQSAAYINGLLKIVEKCFNAKKFDAKMAAFRAWSYLAYNFSINGYLFQEKRIKLMLVPITNSFLHDKSPQLRLAAAYAWADIIYCLGTDNLSKFWNSACQPMLERILKDPSGEIREFGCHVLACLVNTQQVYDKPRPKHIIVGECKVWEYIMNTRLDLRWFRKNTKPFFELLILAISNPPECASEDWKIGEQSKEKLTPVGSFSCSSYIR
ncbi:Rap1-interacting factor 1 N terminal-domain-containing protein [Paraphysoderma sedebokerense]|nr:Rap1-interacting factor 1 N terminal-domain-containing protein [Paraphysoderma sedebokerense]